MEQIFTELIGLQSKLMESDMLTLEFDKRLADVESMVQDIRKYQLECAKLLLGSKDELIKDGMKISKIRVFSKVADLDSVAKGFVKTERKLNIQAVNDYLKENRTLPDGVSEVQTSERISVREAPKPKEKPIRLEKNQEALDFKAKFNKLSKAKK